MINKISRRVPKKTNYNEQHKVIKDWAKVIVELRQSDTKIKAYSVKEVTEKKCE